jgi:hypothetical protein
MWKINLSLVLVAVAAISMSRKMRFSKRYERNTRELSAWNSLDKGIDPTEDKPKS